MALDHIHQRHIVHRDLKLSNLLLDQHGYLKLIDFGLCKLLGSSEATSYTCCGTPEYLPPEMLSREGHAAPADWWAMGIIIYELLTGITPFVDGGTVKTCQQLYANILSKTYRFSFPPQASPGLISMVTLLLNKSQATRMLHPLIQCHARFSGYTPLSCYTPVSCLSTLQVKRMRAFGMLQGRFLAPYIQRHAFFAPVRRTTPQLQTPRYPPTYRPTDRAHPMLHRALSRWNNLLARAVVAPIKPVLNALGGGMGYTALITDDLIEYSAPSLQTPESWDHGF